MGRSKSKRSRGESQAALEPAVAPEVHEEVEAEAAAPVVAPVEVGGDVKALANMFALSGSVFGKKASYARAGEVEAVPAKEKKQEKEQEKRVEAKTGKKKDKKKQKQQQRQIETEEAKVATKTGEKKDRKKDKKKKKQQQSPVEKEEEEAVEEVAAPTEDADEGEASGKKQKKKNRKQKQKEKKKTDAKPTAEEQEEEEEDEVASEAEEEADEIEATTKEAKPEDEAKPVDEAKSRRTVFVGNVSLDASEKDVARHFAPCGKVEAVRLRNLPVAGCAVDQAGNQKLMMKVCANKKIFNDRRETCNAYVVFALEESVPAALALDGSTLLSKKLKVDRETLVVDPRRSVFVGNLAFQLPDDQLRAYFNARLRTDEEREPVENVRIVRDRESGMGKGFGYVLLKTSSLAAKALSLHETKLGTREIRVQVCGKRTKNRRGEESDPSKKHEGLRAAAGARARILLKRKARGQGSEAAEAKRQKLEGAVKTIKPKHAARKARQAAEVAEAAGAAGAGDKKKSSKRPRGDDKRASGRNSKAGARPAKKAKVQKPKHAARKARQAAEAAATS